MIPRQDRTPYPARSYYCTLPKTAGKAWDAYSNAAEYHRPAGRSLCIPVCSPVDEATRICITWLVDELVVQEDECGEKPGRGNQEELLQQVARAPHAARVEPFHRLVVHAEERPLVLHGSAGGGVTSVSLFPMRRASALLVVVYPRCILCPVSYRRRGTTSHNTRVVLYCRAEPPRRCCMHVGMHRICMRGHPTQQTAQVHAALFPRYS